MSAATVGSLPLCPPVNITPNVHMLPGCVFDMFLHLFTATLTLHITYHPSCAGSVMDIPSSLVAAAVQKALSHSNLVDIPPNLLILISHLLLILQYVNIVFSGRPTRLACSANVHCQARTSRRLAHTPASTLSAHGQRFEFCVSILLCCVPWHLEDTQWDTENTSVCVPFVSTRRTPHVCFGSPVCDCEL